MSDYKDLVITQLADTEAELRERVASLEADVQAYRELSQQAIHALAKVTTERDAARRRLDALLDERRVSERAA